MKNISNWFISMALMATVNLQGQDKKLSLEDALTIARENNKALKVEMLSPVFSLLQIQWADVAIYMY